MTDRATVGVIDDPQDPRWGSRGRERKADNIVACLRLLTALELGELCCVDIGCGSGGISYHLARHFRTVCGIDPEPWRRWNDYMSQVSNLQFRQESIDSMGIPDDSVDVVVCNQVYEHVPSPQQLIAQIFRILKPGGACYFAGPNLLYPMEPHLHWPFIHWIPRPLALEIVGALAPHKILDARSTTYWNLRRWLRNFEVVDAVPELIKQRARAEEAIFWRTFRLIPAWLLRRLAWLSPGFVFVLFKPVGPQTNPSAGAPSPGPALRRADPE